MDLEGKNVFITGGSGFIGSNLMRYLVGNCNINKPLSLVEHTYDPKTGRSFFKDFTNSEQTDTCFENCLNSLKTIDIVFNLAGVTGNVKSHGENPVQSFVNNTLMGLNILRSCHKYGAKKVVSIVASCAYPELEWHHGCEKEVMEEETFFDGEPHESIEAHAYAKRNLQLASRYYNKQYGCDFVCVCPPTVYGPGDSFDTAKTKVMGGLIRKFCEAKAGNRQEVSCWGTGSALREFLYIDDCVKLLAKSVAYNDSSIPLNIGSGQEISIKKLAELIAGTVGYTGKISWDKEKPEGQYRKLLDSTRMIEVFGPQTFVPLNEGIYKTIMWLKETENL